MKGADTTPQVAGAALPQTAAPARPRSGPDRHVPFTAHLGIRRERAEGGEAVMSMELAPHLLNNHDAVHGGVIMTLLDVAMSNAALSRVDYQREVVTVDMTVAFMRPLAGKLTATARATGGGRSVCFCEARIEDEGGQLAARGMGTFRYREKG
jgi:uncharacterized protein (TIGR00369 family)